MEFLIQIGLQTEQPHIVKVGNLRHVKREVSRTIELPMDYYENTLQHLMNKTIDERGLVCMCRPLLRRGLRPSRR